MLFRVQDLPHEMQNNPFEQHGMSLLPHFPPEGWNLGNPLTVTNVSSGAEYGGNRSEKVSLLAATCQTLCLSVAI